MENRGNFSNKLGFILAAAGSAVGLGNIWRFPYLAAKYGGGMFILIYLILVVSFGFTLMVTEIAIGRKTGFSPIGAFRTLNKKFTFLGIIAVVVPALIGPYYCVVGGWISKYCALFFTGGLELAASDGFFGSYIAKPVEPVLWQTLFVAATALILIGGVKGGIEKASKVLMPLLVLLSVFIAVYTMFLPGAMDGVKYLFVPHMEDFSISAVIAAMGQMFYSMSLAMGIMITYGSYVKKDEDIEKSVGNIELFDTFIAICAAMMVVPAVFAFSGGDPNALGQGAGLLFDMLPKVFASMPAGGFIGGAFFVLVFFAAITSSVSILEVIISTICDLFHWGRKSTTVFVAVLCLILGIPCSLGYGVWDSVVIMGYSILDFVDFVTNSVMLPIVALLTCILIGFVVGVDTVGDEVKLSSKFRRERMYKVVVRYIAPVLLLTILVTSIFQAVTQTSF